MGCTTQANVTSSYILDICYCLQTLRTAEASNLVHRPILGETHYSVKKIEIEALLSDHKGHNNSYHAYADDRENEEIIPSIELPKRDAS